MTQPEPEFHPDREADKPLVAFIQRYASPVPAANIHAEDRLMRAISSSSVRRQKKRWWQKRSALVLVTGCSLLTYVVWQVNQTLTPPHPATADLAELEQFWMQDLDRLTTTDRAKPLPEWDWVWSDRNDARSSSNLISNHSPHSQSLE